VTLPITTEQYEDEPALVVIDLRALPAVGIECDGFTVGATPDQADALAVALTAKAAAIRRGLPLDITYSDGDDS
jgi:hypothetical protein